MNEPKPHPLQKLYDQAKRLRAAFNSGQRQLFFSDPIDVDIMKTCAVETLKNEKVLKEIVEAKPNTRRKPKKTQDSDGDPGVKESLTGVDLPSVRE